MNTDPSRVHRHAISGENGLHEAPRLLLTGALAASPGRGTAAQTHPGETGGIREAREQTLWSERQDNLCQV